MKKLLIFFGIFPAFINGMEQKPQKTKNYFVCEEINTLDPNGPMSIFENLAKKMRHYDLNTCECIKFLSKQKEEKVLNFLKAKFIAEKTEQEWHELLDFIKSKKRDFKAAQNKKLTIVYLPDIPEHICDEIGKAYSKHKVKGTLLLKKSDKISINEYSFPIAAEIDTKNKHHVLAITEKVFNSPKVYRNFIFNHEAIHHKKFDTITGHIATMFSNPDYFKFSRFIEGRADNIAAACGDCQVARDMESFYHQEVTKDNKLFKEFSKAEFRTLLEKNFNVNLDHVKTKKELIKQWDRLVDPVHPPLQKAYLEAKKIRKLREAEEKLKIDEID